MRALAENPRSLDPYKTWSHLAGLGAGIWMALRTVRRPRPLGEPPVLAAAAPVLAAAALAVPLASPPCLLTSRCAAGVFGKSTSLACGLPGGAAACSSEGRV